MAFTLNLWIPDKKRNVKELVKIRPMLNEKSLVYIYPDYFDLNFTYYYNSDWFKQPEKLHSLLSSQRIFPIMQAEHVDSTLLQQYNDIYLIGASGEASSSCNGIYERLQHFLSEKEISVFYEHLYLVHFTRKKKEKPPRFSPALQPDFSSWAQNDSTSGTRAIEVKIDYGFVLASSGRTSITTSPCRRIRNCNSSPNNRKKILGEETSFIPM